MCARVSYVCVSCMVCRGVRAYVWFWDYSWVPCAGGRREDEPHRPELVRIDRRHGQVCEIPWQVALLGGEGQHSGPGWEQLELVNLSRVGRHGANAKLQTAFHSVEAVPPSAF